MPAHPHVVGIQTSFQHVGPQLAPTYYYIIELYLCVSPGEGFIVATHYMILSLDVTTVYRKDKHKKENTTYIYIYMYIYIYILIYILYTYIYIYIYIMHLYTHVDTLMYM